jgi:hypothetical protein
MDNKVITPETPYIFKSGRHQNECVESFIFKNSNYLFEVRNRKHRTGDALDKHLDFIFEAGDQLSTAKVCPFCQQKMVKYFLFNHNLLLPELTCCQEHECQKSLKELHPTTNLIRFRLSSLGLFKKITARKKAEIFFKKIYGLPRRITPQIVFFILQETINKKDPEQ